MSKKLAALFIAVMFPVIVMAQDQVYMINYNKVGLQAEIVLNGVPFCTYAQGDVSASENVNLWIMPGKNTIAISVSAKKAESNSAYVSAGISLQAPWSYDNAKPKLITIEVPQFDAQNEGERLPLVLPFNKQYEFLSTVVPPVKLWNDASVLVLDAKTIAEASALVNQLFALLDKRDGTGYFYLNSYAMSETALSSGYDLKTYMDNARKGFAALFTQKEFVFKKPKAGDLTFKLVANGKVVMIGTKGGRPSLDVGIFSKNIFLARINNKLTIVR